MQHIPFVETRCGGEPLCPLNAAGSVTGGGHAVDLIGGSLARSPTIGLYSTLYNDPITASEVARSASALRAPARALSTMAALAEKDFATSRSASRLASTCSSLGSSQRRPSPAPRAAWEQGRGGSGRRQRRHAEGRARASSACAAALRIARRPLPALLAHGHVLQPASQRLTRETPRRGSSALPGSALCDRRQGTAPGGILPRRPTPALPRLEASSRHRAHVGARAALAFGILIPRTPSPRVMGPVRTHALLAAGYAAVLRRWPERAPWRSAVRDLNGRSTPGRLCFRATAQGYFQWRPRWYSRPRVWEPPEDR